MIGYSLVPYLIENKHNGDSEIKLTTRELKAKRDRQTDRRAD